MCFTALLALNVQEKYNSTLRKALEQNGSDMQKYQNYFL